MRIRDTKGFTLIELLIVVAIIGIIAAIAVPGLLSARRAGNEASAIGSLRAITSSQQAYASTCANGFYAGDLTDLAVLPVGGGAPFISPDLGAAASGGEERLHGDPGAGRRRRGGHGDGSDACNTVPAARSPSARGTPPRSPSRRVRPARASSGWARSAPSTPTPRPSPNRRDGCPGRPARPSSKSSSSRNGRTRARFPPGGRARGLYRRPRAARLPAYNSHHVALVPRIRCARRGRLVGVRVGPLPAALRPDLCQRLRRQRDVQLQPRLHQPVRGGVGRAGGARWGCCSSCS